MAVTIKTLTAVTVTSAGTRVPLSATHLLVYSVTIQSLESNTGTQYIGDGTVSSTNGFSLSPGNIVEIDSPDARGVDQFDLNDVYVDSTVNAAEFRILAWIRE